jgi:hypothetical protein
MNETVSILKVAEAILLHDRSAALGGHLDGWDGLDWLPAEESES